MLFAQKQPSIGQAVQSDQNSWQACMLDDDRLCQHSCDAWFSPAAYLKNLYLMHVAQQIRTTAECKEIGDPWGNKIQKLVLVWYRIVLQRNPHPWYWILHRLCHQRSSASNAHQNHRHITSSRHASTPAYSEAPYFPSWNCSAWYYL